jgi:flagellar protein FliO/FliZ
MDTFFSLIKMIAFLLIILYLINVSLKYLNRYTNQQNNQLRILQKIAVSKTSSIGIVQILDKYYVMSFSEQQNQILKELSEEEATVLMTKKGEVSELQRVPDFSEWVKKAKNQLEMKRGKQK